MNLFYFAIAAVAPFYCIFFLSLLRDVIDSYSASGPDTASKKHQPTEKKHQPVIKRIFMAHWVTRPENIASTPFTLFKNPMSGLMSGN